MCLYITAYFCLVRYIDTRFLPVFCIFIGIVICLIVYNHRWASAITRSRSIIYFIDGLMLLSFALYYITEKYGALLPYSFHHF